MGLIAFTLSCSRPTLTREAFLTFDNLTGDPSLDWVSQSAPLLLTEDLTGVPKIVALTTPTVRDAYLNHADRLVHGYYELRSGKLHFEVSVEDARTHRTVQTAEDDGQPGDALNRAAKILAPDAHANETNEAAIAAWGQGDYEKAVTLDPRFWPAWRGWVQSLASSGNQAGAVDVAQRAASQPALSSGGSAAQLEKARLDLDMAEVLHDDSARLAALRQLSSLIPYDPALAEEAAQLDMSDRNFADAVKYYRQAAADDPSNLDFLNPLGYAEGLAGDLTAARKTFTEYARAPGEAQVNALDSLGESLFINGKFDDAEREFLDAYKKDPNFLQGATLWKAAHARWLAGGAPANPKQLAAADRIAEQYFELRAKAHDPVVIWRRALWLYETGRQKEAEQLLMQPAGNPTEASFAQQQLVVWSQPLTLNTAAIEQSYRRAQPVEDGLARVLYAETLLEAGKKDDARQLLKRWPLPVREDTPLASLLYPKFFELRKLTN